jgi:hypothetical protein
MLSYEIRNEQGVLVARFRPKFRREDFGFLYKEVGGRRIFDLVWEDMIIRQRN